MSEGEWDEYFRAWNVLEPLRGLGKLSERKARLFSVACCRRIWPLIRPGAYRDVVEVAERFADGQADWEDVRAAEYLAYRLPGVQPGDAAQWAAAHTATEFIFELPYREGEDTTHFHAAIASGRPIEEHQAQVAL